ncbi:MAG TPA: aminodeoxychorismate synthase component I [Cyclobacteriaceae bacterium]|jgi:para-aminobenzoate synthetase component 1|nr:aminodeoxychorismate synthase component I [Cyclobacteriaceae bacterium]
MNLSEFELKLNKWGQDRVPFFFLIDFEMERPQAWKQGEIPGEILYSLGEKTNVESRPKTPNIALKKHPIPFDDYQAKFNVVRQRISFGDSYLTNLTVKTKIDLNQSLVDLFSAVNAKYKICWSGNFLCFSPETFVKITDGKIRSFPMKGTIDAATPNAQEIILNDAKELSEHVTIVDLIRNDLSSISSNVVVNKFRYVETINTHQKALLQVSSEIRGDLPKNHHSNLGTILTSLLPAGSVSGAPKNKTLQIIADAEKEKRGYYTGVVGYFDGENLDSGVMIRFIEQDGNQFYYRSGGGITSQSQVESEYQEMIDKIYVPIH